MTCLASSEILGAMCVCSHDPVEPSAPRVVLGGRARPPHAMSHEDVTLPAHEAGAPGHAAAPQSERTEARASVQLGTRLGSARHAASVQLGPRSHGVQDLAAHRTALLHGWGTCGPGVPTSAVEQSQGAETAHGAPGAAGPGVALGLASPVGLPRLEPGPSA